MEAFLSYYNLFVFVLSFLWFALFIAREDLRREMLILGVFAIFLMPLIFALNDTGSSEVDLGFRLIGVVDLLFSFSLAGISGVIFHVIFGKHYHKLPKNKRIQWKKEDSHAQIWIMHLFILFLVFVWAVVLLNLLFTLSIPEAFLISAIMTTIYILSHRHDLIADAIWSAFLTAFIAFVAATLTSSITGIDLSIAPIVSDKMIVDVPLDLLLWAMGAGLVLGPLYEYVRTLELK